MAIYTKFEMELQLETCRDGANDTARNQTNELRLGNLSILHAVDCVCRN